MPRSAHHDRGRGSPAGSSFHTPGRCRSPRSRGSCWWRPRATRGGSSPTARQDGSSPAKAALLGSHGSRKAQTPTGTAPPPNRHNTPRRPGPTTITIATGEGVGRETSPSYAQSGVASDADGSGRCDLVSDRCQISEGRRRRSSSTDCGVTTTSLACAREEKVGVRWVPRVKNARYSEVGRRTP